jgi:surface antigen
MGRASGGDSYVAPQARLENPVAAPEAQPVDEVVAAEVAANAATAAHLLVTPNVTNRADTLDAQVKLATKTDEATTSVIEKPQLVASDVTTNSNVITITTQKGDSVASLAKTYGISEDTIRWANNLGSDDLTAGVKLKILPVSGLLYTVESGDTAANIAAKFKTTKDQITAYNDLEVKGLRPGSQIIVPNGVKPAETPSYSTSSSASSAVSSPSSAFAFGGGVEFSGNKYAYGYCTYYAYNKRAAAGRPVGSNWGNASSWGYLAAASGFAVDNNPRAGDVFQTSGGWGGYGHVGYVERVNADGSVLVSEMNYAGWNVISSRTLSAGEAKSYNFIH